MCPAEPKCTYHHIMSLVLLVKFYKNKQLLVEVSYVKFMGPQKQITILELIKTHITCPFTVEMEIVEIGSITGN